MPKRSPEERAAREARRAARDIGKKKSAPEDAPARAPEAPPEIQQNADEVGAIVKDVLQAEHSAARELWNEMEDRRAPLRVFHAYLLKRRGAPAAEANKLIREAQRALGQTPLQADAEVLKGAHTTAPMHTAQAAVGALEALTKFSDMFAPAVVWALGAHELPAPKPTAHQLQRLHLITALVAHELELTEVGAVGLYKSSDTRREVAKALEHYQCGADAARRPADAEQTVLLHRAMQNLTPQLAAIAVAALFLDAPAVDPVECALLRHLLRGEVAPRVKVESKARASWLASTGRWLSAAIPHAWINQQWARLAEKHPLATKILETVGELGAAVLRAVKWALVKLLSLAAWLGPRLLRILKWAYRNPRQAAVVLLAVAALGACGYVALYGIAPLSSAFAGVFASVSRLALHVGCVALRVIPRHVYGAAGAYAAHKAGAIAMDRIEKGLQGARVAAAFKDSGIWQGMLQGMLLGAREVSKKAGEIVPGAEQVVDAGIALADPGLALGKYFPQVAIFLSGDIIKRGALSFCDAAGLTLGSFMSEFPSADALATLAAAMVLCQSGGSEEESTEYANKIRKHLARFEGELPSASPLRSAQLVAVNLLSKTLLGFCSVAPPRPPTSEARNPFAHMSFPEDKETAEKQKQEKGYLSSILSWISGGGLAGGKHRRTPLYDRAIVDALYQ